MSDSDDLGGVGGTTPDMLLRLAPNNTAGSSRTAPNKRNVVSVHSDDEEVQEVIHAKTRKRGVAASTASSKRKRKGDESEEVENPHDPENRTRRRRRDEVEIAGDESVAEEEVQEVGPPVATKKGRGGSRKPRSAKVEVLTNGNVKGKGKAKASGAMDVDEVELFASEEDAQAGVQNLANAINSANKSEKSTTSRMKQVSREDKAKYEECARLREQLRQAQGHIDDLKRQLEGIHQVRVTEAERLLEGMEALHRKERQASEALINDLREQLARKDPLLRTARNTAFELLTREEADKDNQGLRDQVKSNKEIIRNRDQIIKEREDEVVNLTARVKDLQYELQVEIEKSNKVSQKPPDSASRARRGRVLSPNEDPKMGEVVRFYEDLTNLLVTDVKPQPGRYLQLEDWLLTCVYSYRDVMDRSSAAKSLSFKLRQCYEPKGEEPKSKNDLAESLQYTPLELEKESEDFVQSLGFLKDPFTFEREQLALFLRTLHDVVSGDGNESDGSDDRVQIMG